MVLLIFSIASDTSFYTSLHKKNGIFKDNDDIKNAFSGILANDLKFPSIFSVARIMQ